MRLVRHFRSNLLEFGLVVMCTLALLGLVAAIVWRSFWLHYQLFVPSTASHSPLPLLVVLHGRSGNIVDLQAWLGFDAFAEKFGFLVIYPQSHYDAWDFGVGVRIRGHTARRYVDHTKYIQNIIDRVGQGHNVDRSRIYLAGVSDGASMAMRMSCSTSNYIRAIVSVAATLAVYAVDECTNPLPMPVMFVHGTADTVMPWAGMQYKHYSVYMSMEDSIAWWRQRNGCDDALSDNGDFKPFIGSVDLFSITGCEQGSSIVAIRVNGGGHTWPGRDHPSKRTTGPVNRDINITQIISEWIADDIWISHTLPTWPFEN